MKLVPDAHDPSQQHAPMMLTTDLALEVDPAYPFGRMAMNDEETAAPSRWLDNPESSKARSPGPGSSMAWHSAGTPPKNADVAIAAAKAADLILIPCRAQIDDIETLPATKQPVGCVIMHLTPSVEKRHKMLCSSVLPDIVVSENERLAGEAGDFARRSQQQRKSTMNAPSCRRETLLGRACPNLGCHFSRQGLPSNRVAAPE